MTTATGTRVERSACSRRLVAAARLDWFTECAAILSEPYQVLIYEPSGGTHLYQYVGLMARACAALGCRVVLSLSSAADSLPGYNEFIKPLVSDATGRVAMSAVHPPLSGMPVRQTARKRLEWLIQSIEAHHPDRVLVPFGDGLMHEVGRCRLLGRRALPRGVPVDVLLFKARPAYPPGDASWKARLQDAAKWRLANAGRWDRKFHIDPFVHELQRRQRIRSAKRFLIMPEPLEPSSSLTREAARSFLGLPGDGRLIVLPGGIDERKGADLLCRAFAIAPLEANDRLLLIGQVDAPTRDLLGREYRAFIDQGRLIVRDGFVTDEQLTAAIRAADVVAVPHRSCFQSSGITLRAVVAGRWLVGTERGWIGRMLRLFGLGRPCDTFDPDVFSQALTAALDEAGAFKPGEPTRRLAAFHTIKNFQAAWTDAIRQQLALGSAAERPTWEWVREAARPSSLV